MDDPTPRAFDTPAFWTALGVCSLPFLLGITLFFSGVGGFGEQAFFALLWVLGGAYVVTFVWMVYAVGTRDTARGLALFAAMLVSLLIGPGSCFVVVLSSL